MKLKKKKNEEKKRTHTSATISERTIEQMLSLVVFAYALVSWSMRVQELAEYINANVIESSTLEVSEGKKLPRTTDSRFLRNPSAKNFDVIIIHSLIAFRAKEEKENSPLSPTLASTINSFYSFVLSFMFLLLFLCSFSYTRVCRRASTEPRSRNPSSDWLSN